MKLVLGIVIAGLSLFAGTPEEDVKQAIEQWKTAVIQKDKGALDRLIHPQVTYGHSNAKMENKQQAIDAFLAPTMQYHAIDMADTTVRLKGNTALVQTIMTVKNAQNGESRTLPLSVLMVWVKEKGGWQLLARQSTRLP